MKIVGYNLRGQDNDTYLLKDDSCLSKCAGCGYRLDFFPNNPDYVPSKKATDISATYDGQTIVSKVFKEFCDRNEYRSLDFRAFKSNSNYFHLVPTQIIKFDAARRKTRFIKLCPVCGNFESVAGADPSYLMVVEPLKDGFYRSDLLFASGNEKHPLLLVGIDTKAKLEGAKLKGLEFAPAYGIE